MYPANQETKIANIYQRGAAQTGSDFVRKLATRCPMNPPYHILIVEDELLIAEMLREMLVELGYKVAGVAANYNQVLRYLSEDINVDLCFVDINLESSHTGFDVARELGRTFQLPFVFLTSYADRKTITEAAALQPEAYLLKPFSQPDLLTTIEIIRARKKNELAAVPEVIVIKDGALNIRVNVSDILWLKSDNVYVEVKTAAKTYLVRSSLEGFLTEYPSASFVRVHRSYVVNFSHVHAVTGKALLIGDDKIPLSRSHREEFHRQYKAV